MNSRIAGAVATSLCPPRSSWAKAGRGASSLVDRLANTYWDWIVNHVPQINESMGEVSKFVATFKEFPPRSVPPSFSPATLLDETLREIKAKQKLESAFPMLRQETPKPKE